MHAADGLTLYPTARDAHVFLQRLERVASRHAIEVHCYCLMSTHYHLLIRDLDGGISAAMGDLNGWYSRHYNTRHERRGPVFDGRFHRTLIERDEHLHACIRYIVRNPVEAGLCAAPGDWARSSHRATVGAAPRPPFLRTELLLGNPESLAPYLKLVNEAHA
jgi:putative transposase